MLLSPVFHCQPVSQGLLFRPRMFITESFPSRQLPCPSAAPPIGVALKGKRLTLIA
jgi:hypothetical protein